ncbi:MAG: D-alanine--D-alanine ligase [Holosporales bacterium]|jgi:D-alanine-D-alanine ligase|nr:D-alanine--D-alanine ligase [Holosporales bacterium]
MTTGTNVKISRIAIISGGTSGEREISISSARGMHEALVASGKYQDVAVFDVGHNIVSLIQDLVNFKPDVILNALHGVGGEDGVIQGVLETLGIPYTHSGVTASAIAMDKVYSRIIFSHAKIPVPTWGVYPSEQLSQLTNMPFVMKPRCEGSSLGISIIKSNEDLIQALAAWKYGEFALVEEYIPGKEVQTAVFDGVALGTIEIRPHREFFDYRAKYTVGETDHIMPADIPDDVYAHVQELAERAYHAIGCRGMTRLDFMLKYENGTWTPYLLELNTQPGMTPCSLVPDIAKHLGWSYLEVIERMLISAVNYWNSN